MFSKIYKNVVQFIRENFLYLLLYLFLLFIIIFPVNYNIITGGGTILSDTKVEVKGAKKSKGSFSFCYVEEIKGTIFTYILSYIIPSYEKESLDDYKISDSDSRGDIEFRNNMWMNQVNSNAIYVAFNALGKEVKLKENKNYVSYITEQAKTDLKIGDEVISVDDIKITDIDNLKEIVSGKSVGDKVSINVRRGSKKIKRYAYVYEEKGELYIGISLINNKEYDTDPLVNIKFKSRENGPSGGLILTLQIYNLLTTKDITHGLDIAGTGTMEEDGSVLDIDGVKYKLKGAVDDKKDVFIVPSGRNYKEAINEKKKNNYKIKIIGVKDFQDALTKLENLE